MSDNTKMREAFVQACKEYGPTISFSDFECGWDACMAWQAARTVPEGYVMVQDGILDVVRDIVDLHSRTGTVLRVKVDELAHLLSAAPEGKK